ncbi:MAG: hypothetical protein QOE66_125, partial [Chloroflexota bacterium]|nr:hypothetical protein [Chloroflexota bacterium]
RQGRAEPAGGAEPAGEAEPAGQDAPERRDLAAEIAAAGGLIAELGGSRPRIDPVTVPGLTDHVLVVIDKVGPTPAGYPRDPATRRRPS